MLCIEATRSVATERVEVETPIRAAVGQRLASTFVAVPILRAGLGMLEAVTELFPEVLVGYIGLERDHATFEPSLYYSKLPPLQGRTVLLLDPMLATGGSATAAATALFAAGAESVSLISVVCAPEGVDHLESRAPLRRDLHRRPRRGAERRTRTSSRASATSATGSSARKRGKLTGRDVPGRLAGGGARG